MNESFDDPALPGWERTPNAIVADGVLRIRGEGYAIHPGGTVSGSLTLRLRFDGDGFIELRYRISDAGMYLVRLSPGEILLVRDAGGRQVTLTSAPSNLVVGEWWLLEMSLAGAELHVFVVPGVELHAVDDDPLPGAGLMLHVFGEAVGEFDDLTLAPAEGGPSPEAPVPHDSLAPEVLMIRVGTSGFSYKDWVGPVYPPDLAEREWLEFYAREFSTVELNVTFYRVPSAKTIAGWLKHTPQSFLFAVKAFQGLTHERAEPDFRGFVEAIRPMSESGRMGCILAQFPYAFHATPSNREYLRQLREGLGDLPAVVEFRNAGWVSETTHELLASLNLGYCCVDEPALRGLMPPVAVATGPVAYVRFHGRNVAKWFEHKEAWERYDYTYSRDELKEWVPRLEALEEQSELALVYFNNHYRGQGVQGARDLLALLGEGRF